MEETERQELVEEYIEEKRKEIHLPIISKIKEHIEYVKYLEKEVIRLDEKDIDYQILLKQVKEVSSFNNYDKDTKFAEYKSRKIAELINEFEDKH